MVKNPEAYRNRKVVLAGGGDSALDWAIFPGRMLPKKLRLSIAAIPFRGAPDSAEKVFELANQGRNKPDICNRILQAIAGNGSFTGGRSNWQWIKTANR